MKKKYRVIGGFEEWHQYTKIYFAESEEDAEAMALNELDEDGYSDVFEFDRINSDVFEIVGIYDVTDDHSENR